MWKLTTTIVLILICVQSTIAGETVISKLSRITPEDGDFMWPYYLFTPDTRSLQSDSLTILVWPNNSGKCDDDIAFHDKRALRQVKNVIDMVDRHGIALLVPVFPRSASDWQIYTHALDRDAILTDKPDIKRLDLQLVAMVEDARTRLSGDSIKVRRKILMFGHSASGMFTNRFTVLHPELVKAAVIGSPGGWPIAPLAEWEGKELRYPVGVSDLEELTGAKWDRQKLAEVPMFIFLGDQDDNDAVAFDDAYDLEDRTLVFELFGETPVSRWPVILDIYEKAGCDCTFKLYEDVGHATNGEMWKDIGAFIVKNLQD